MAISFKTLTQTDRTTSRTLLHESIPITGSLISGSYSTSSFGRGINIKTFSHGMFQSVYDYPYLSSSANHIFDITWGYTSSSQIDQENEGSRHVALVENQVNKKKNIYTQMAQILQGFDVDSKVKPFDTDGNHSGGSKWGSLVFLSFSRLLVKDEIKKGSFRISLGAGSSFGNPFSTVHTFTDEQATSSYKINSPAGEYGILKVPGVGGQAGSMQTRGLIFYQAGIVCLGWPSDYVAGDELTTEWISSSAEGVSTAHEVAISGTIDDFNDGFLRRIQSISFNNTTELNSTIYFCRANNSEFNYSSNPTYLSGSKIRVKTDPGTRETMNLPRSYVTTVGLYSHDNELMAVAKLSEPLRKDPTNELNLRVRLDY